MHPKSHLYNFLELWRCDATEAELSQSTECVVWAELEQFDPDQICIILSWIILCSGNGALELMSQAII